MNPLDVFWDLEVMVRKPGAIGNHYWKTFEVIARTATEAFSNWTEQYSSDWEWCAKKNPRPSYPKPILRRSE